MVEIKLTSEQVSTPKKTKKKESKLGAILWALLYFGLIIGLCLSGTWAFVKYYYYPIYVSGPSMEPTLSGGGSNKNPRFDFGYIDTHKNAINCINRFDIITTFYPFSAEDYSQPYVSGSNPINNAKHKIKRVIALPGDTFTIRDNELIFRDVETNIDEVCELPFNVKNSDSPEGAHFSPVDFKTKGFGDEEGFVTLKENEYWVMGDNWLGSRDSYSDQKGGPIYKENIVGVLIAIVGTCLVRNDEIYDKQYTFPRFYK